MNILALGGSTHDYSACLLKEGKIKVYIEEERITRKKHSLDLGTQTFRCKAAQYCLDTENLSIDDIDFIIANDILDEVYYAKFLDRLLLMNHHLSHAASAYFPSPFNQAAIIVADGRGSFEKSGVYRETISGYFGQGKEIKHLWTTYGIEKEDLSISNSVGMFYEAITFEIGFGYLQEGKTMGLAPYGNGQYVSRMADFYSIEAGEFIQSIEQLKEMRHFIRDTLFQSKSPTERWKVVANFAFAAQYHIERIIISICNRLYQETGCPNLTAAGGVFLNSVTNYKILEETPFKNIFIQPAAGDAGTSIGSALYCYHVINNCPRTMSKLPFSPYLGKAYSNKEVSSTLSLYKDKIIIERPKDLYTTAAKLLADEKIIGWFTGQSEVGPRALGNRSILANPLNHKTKDIINSRIKHREAFRPFAPIVLQEKTHEYFDIQHPTYYMLLVPPIIYDKRSEIPSVCHVDGTGRVQSVTKEMNIPLYNLLSAFEQLTGTPVLLNTSFNDNGEPLVETPEDAIKCFLKIDLDCLVLNGWLLYKK